MRVSNALPWPATVLLGATVADEALRVRLDPAGPLIVPAAGACAVELHMTRRAPGVAQTQVITVWGRQPGEEQASPPRLTCQIRVHDTPGGHGRVVSVRPRLPRWGVPVVTLVSLLLALAVAAGAGTWHGLPAQPAPRSTRTPALMRTVLAVRVVRRTPTRPGVHVPPGVHRTTAPATPGPTVALPPSRPTSIPHPQPTPRAGVTPTPTVFTITLS